MSSTFKSSKRRNKKTPAYWGVTPTLTPEQTVEWLDGFRQLMFEAWKNNPKLIPAEKKRLLKDWRKK